MPRYIYSANASRQRPRCTPPRHGDVDDRAEEEEEEELEQAAFHENILRRWLSSPAAFGAAKTDNCLVNVQLLVFVQSIDRPMRHLDLRLFGIPVREQLLIERKKVQTGFCFDVID